MVLHVEYINKDLPKAHAIIVVSGYGNAAAAVVEYKVMFDRNDDKS